MTSIGYQFVFGSVSVVIRTVSITVLSVFYQQIALETIAMKLEEVVIGTNGSRQEMKMIDAMLPTTAVESDVAIVQTDSLLE